MAATQKLGLLSVIQALGLMPKGRAGATDAAGTEPKKPSAARQGPKDAAPREPMTVGRRQGMAQRPPSFTDLLPYVSYEADAKTFVLGDGTTLGALFELGAVPTEAQAPAYLIDKARKVQEALQALPESTDTPWVVQFFVNDDRDISGLNTYLRDYIAQVHERYPERRDAILSSPYTQAVLKEFEKHLALVSRPQGLFTDTLVSGQPWRGQQRRVRCAVYKRFTRLSEDPSPAQQQIEAVSVTLMATLQESGVQARRCSSREFYEWLLPFFNRKVPWASRHTGDLLEQLPYPGDQSPAHDADGREAAPVFGWDMADLLSVSPPVSDAEAGLFEFDGVPVKALTLDGMRTNPNIGHFTAERSLGKEAFARFDRLPAGCMLSITVTVEPQHRLDEHIARIRDASRAQTPLAMETHKECVQVLKRMIEGDKLYPMLMTLYVTAPTREELGAVISQVNAQLVPSGLRFIDARQDLVALDSFIRGLPFAFDPAFDAKQLRRTRLTFASQIAALLPVYGRSRGTPHPGMWFWNRGGEPLWVDPLNRHDRKKNAHMLVLGPTGAGKSATLNYIAMLTMAVHRPRLVIADAGRSFSLLMDYFKTMGLSTYSVTLTNEADVSLPPFFHSHRLLGDQDVMSSYRAAEQQARQNAGMPDDASLDALLDGKKPAEIEREPTAASGDEADADDEGTDKRDLLGEMLIAAIMMITGGEQQEVERMSRADRYLITNAIIRAATRSAAEGRKHPLTHDVAIDLMGMHADATLSPARQARAEEMGQAMMSFTQGLRGKLFNREGVDWPDADVTLVEMGTLTQDGYGDALAVAYTSLIDSVQSRGERAQAEDRPLIMLTDEGHLITTNELLGPKIAKGTKMWRKLNIWFWLATQNLKDFPDSMSRVLSMCEYWMLLTMDRSEIEEVARFRSLTPEQRALMESARKEPPKYTEGVLISASDQALIRNVPPALPIALAMTEGHEKAHRRRLMDQHGCSEMQAAQLVADELTAKRG